ncbi:hypothetical protein HD554DRAFT_1111305 [Boletus coccyginus]|nr:hypothetical protein HD554DRAFT_1111305 [Boletus coccyginus]
MRSLWLCPTSADESMCHRRLKFVRHTACGHLTFLRESLVDCGSDTCTISSAHPPDCNSPQKPCSCRRYYGQPQRLVTRQVPEKCSTCPP